MQEFKVDIDFSKYRGKYVAIIDNRIIASGENAKLLLESVKAKYPKKEVVLRKIPEEETLILVIKCR